MAMEVIKIVVQSRFPGTFELAERMKQEKIKVIPQILLIANLIFPLDCNCVQQIKIVLILSPKFCDDSDKFGVVDTDDRFDNPIPMFSHSPSRAPRKMTNPSAMAENPYHVRSISLPTRSPLVATIEEELEKLRCSEAFSPAASAVAICSGLCSLGEVYDRVAELLVLPQTQQALAQNKNEKWVEELLDGSVKLVDICDATRNVLLHMKEDGKELNSALRRRKGELSMESKVSNYLSSRKKLRKEIKKRLATLKKTDGKAACSHLPDQKKHLYMVVTFLQQVKSVTISIFHSILSFLFSSPKASKWSLVSKLMNKGYVNKGEQNTNEVESVDLALSSLQNHITEMESVKQAQKQMELLEVRLDSLEGGLERVFRRLIHTRVSLLNILTQ
ncbi:uncharacterized protein [Aristolochia californica]|uniref:uncharacterized protein n=1 Tax=Aristolochia californica TaxID=171875 RepID=UPI0035DE9E91